MSPRHGRTKPKPSLTPDAARHQERVERARLTYDRVVIVEREALTDDD